MGASLSALARNKTQGSALLRATRAGELDRVDEVLSGAPGAISYCTLEGVTSLHVAAGDRRCDLLERLLIALQQAGAHRQAKPARRAFSKTINQKNVHGQTALMLACRSGAADCVRLLLEAGADATLFDDLQQRTCLHYAALHGWAEAVEALLEDESVVPAGTGGGQRQPLREALIADSQGHHRYIDGRALLGLAPLHLAASQGHLAAVKALLKWGASLTVRCNVAFDMGATEPWTPAATPLHFAAARGKGRVVQALLQAAAAEQQRQQQQGQELPDLRLFQDFRGQRPYEIALAMGHRSFLWMLNPRVPLGALLQQPQQAEAVPTVPTLAALAATALRRQLMQQLEELKLAALADASCKLVHAAGAAAAGGGEGGGWHISISKRGSRSGSREGSAHGGTGYFAIGAAAAAAAAAGSKPQPGAGLVAGLREGSRGLHIRRASDGGDCSIGTSGASHAFQSAAAGGSWRGVAGYHASPSFPAALPHPGGGAATPPYAAGGLSLAEAAANASILSHHTVTSATSLSGCPVCLDSRLEVTAVPCGHGLCLECAQHLASPGSEDCCSSGAPLCPLCRGVMAAFRQLHE